MAKPKEKVMPKKRGRPATGKEPMMAVRMPPVLIGEIEAWADARGITRSAALRRLVELGLSASPTARSRSPATRSKAADMAAATIDKHGDQAASAEERESRKRRLLKGPKEFRNLRKDHK
jgi:hypothetical protein